MTLQLGGAAARAAGHDGADGQLAEALKCYDAAAKLDEKLADAANAADFIRKNFDDGALAGGAPARTED